MQLSPGAFKMISEKYSKLKTKYGLPSFEELNNEFEISIIEKDDFLLREIRRKLIDKAMHIAEILGSALGGEAPANAMIEFGKLTEAEMKKSIELYKKLMYLERLSVETAIIADEKKDAEFIKIFYDEWKSLKPQILKVLSRLKEGWKEKEESKDDSSIFG